MVNLWIPFILPITQDMRRQVSRSGAGVPPPPQLALEWATAAREAINSGKILPHACDDDCVCCCGSTVKDHAVTDNHSAVCADARACEGTPAAKSWQHSLLNAQVTVLFDVIGAGLGDRALLVQFIHALAATGAKVTVFYTCPARLREAKPQQTAQLFLKRRGTDSAGFDWLPTDVTVIDGEPYCFTLEGADYFAWMTGFRDLDESRLPAETMGEYCQKVYGLDLTAIRKWMVPRIGEASEHKFYTHSVVVSSGRTNADLLSEAQARALSDYRAELAAAELRGGILLPMGCRYRLKAVGYGDSELPFDVSDYRNLSLADTIEVVRWAGRGYSPDTGLAHLGGMFGVPWTIFVREGKFSRWWCGHYPTATFVTA